MPFGSTLSLRLQAARTGSLDIEALASGASAIYDIIIIGN